MIGMVVQQFCLQLLEKEFTICHLVQKPTVTVGLQLPYVKIQPWRINLPSWSASLTLLQIQFVATRGHLS